MFTKKFTKVFLKELTLIPIDYRLKIEKLVFDCELDTIIKKCIKLKGYINNYKIRFGNYRVGITIKIDSKEIIFERVAHRKDIYRIFPSK